ncbi:hypothetical protein [Sphingomonas sp. RIT328]|uniref:hypothetical protein n=1 Tax=Sphingomonas sp. RIT328 TaxID=1470591 RepID=UPI00044A7906|nr:hypothetical protein [Sphingomonas sp. RIT328]EZP54180.1 hypothetical protein BW41_01710 [Sphingomonas sp. RIT328]
MEAIEQLDAYWPETPLDLGANRRAGLYQPPFPMGTFMARTEQSDEGHFDIGISG